MSSQGEIIWTLANIAAGKSAHTKLVLRKCLNIFVQFLDEEVGEERKVDIVWTFCNISGDSPECRDALLNVGILPRVLGLIEECVDSRLEKNCFWFISNVLRYQPVSNEVVNMCLPVLVQGLNHANPDILPNVCWSFKYLTATSEELITTIIDAGVCQPLVNLLQSVLFSSFFVCQSSKISLLFPPDMSH